MARITAEDCLVVVPNMYELVLVATKRTRQLYRGADPLVRSRNRVHVTALREIAANKVRAAIPEASNGLDDEEENPIAELNALN